MGTTTTSAVKAVYSWSKEIDDETAAHHASILTGKDVKVSTASRRLRELRRKDGLPPRKRATKYVMPKAETPKKDPWRWYDRLTATIIVV